jgi:hypothetical protein
MKSFYIACVSLLICVVTPVWGQDAVDEVVIPTEISQPPYAVGNLISEDGYTILLEDATRINFRIVNNLIRIYWLDENKLIMQPPASAAIVRFPFVTKAQNYSYAVPLSGDVGLGAPAVLPPPHIYNVALTIVPYEGAPESEMSLYNFRYTADMDPGFEE